MHRLGAILVIGFSLFALAPMPAAAAANLPILNPDFAIVPEACKACPCGFGGALQLVQNVVNAGVALAIVVVVIVIAWAGITFMLTPTNPENRTKARQMLTNAVIGLVILLSAWLVVDSVMKLLYRAGEGKDGDFLPWNEILTGGDTCIVENTNLKKLFNGSVGDFFTQKPGSGATGPEGGAGTGGVSVPSGNGVGACNSSKLQAAASQGGFTLSQSDARTFACIAQFESSCGTKVLNYNWNKGSSAAGPFQVLLGDNAKYYETPACQAAAGVSGQLNCAAGFRNGNPIPGSPIAQQCVKAASNLACSLSAAVALKNASGSFRPWTGNSDSSKGAQACVGR
ncbi:MAG TPA: pilin [Candidatus Paceibacterota bacterium]|nr:pilin [Candidatus Paceibacterota bacterium]